MRVLAVGEILWDVYPDAERLGGAPLNVAIHAARLGHESAIVSALGTDSRGDRALAETRAAGVDDRFVARTHRAPTGIAEVGADERSAPTFRIPRPAAFDWLALDAAALAGVKAWAPDWIVHGTLAQASPAVRETTEAIVAACPGSRRLYDVNLRPGVDDPVLIASLLSAATVAKVNLDEASWLATTFGLPAAIASFARALTRRFDLRGACITRGGDGADLLLDGRFVQAPAPRTEVVDTVGAGDAFAAALIHGIDAGWAEQAVLAFATAVGSLVAGRPGATPAWTMAELSPPDGPGLGP